ncbi:MAG: hypothetical protein Q8862_12035, partial [Bacteroidota bacterium]|nr:hypothetical protein [Bacteroidota bacterium]
SGYGQTRSHPPFVSRDGDDVYKYLLFAPGMMGPNALPVPNVAHGRVGETLDLELGVDGHSMTGDHAVNSYFNLYYPIVSGVVAIQLFAYPTETFRMSNAVRDQRQIYYDDTGVITQTGDLYFLTELQILKNRKWFPDMAFTYAYKTTTGDVKHARYTHSPAHYFHISLGKEYSLNSFVRKMGFYGMGGLFVWQTNREEVSQDEGPLFGFENKLWVKHFCLTQSISGYHAYEETGENKPVIYKVKMGREGKKLDVGIEYQKGLRNYYYNTLRLSIVFHFPVCFKIVPNSDKGSKYIVCRPQ